MQRAGGPSATARLRAERHRDEGKYQAGSGKCQAAVQFDARLAPASVFGGRSSRSGSLRIAQLPLLAPERGPFTSIGQSLCPKAVTE